MVKFGCFHPTPYVVTRFVDVQTSVILINYFGLDAIFSNFCEENGYGDVHIAGDVGGGVEESVLVEFDKNFPVQKTTNNTEVFIHQLIKKFYYHPNASLCQTPPSYDILPILNHLKIELVLFA